MTLDTNNNACDPFGYQFIDGTSFSAPLTAGAVALIKSARPGLTGDDYRSLVVNSASPMLDDNGNTWPVLSAGAGSLDVLQAIKSTVTAYPITLSFGATGSSVATNQQLTLKNVGTARTKEYRRPRPRAHPSISLRAAPCTCRSRIWRLATIWD
jgi:subtilisin family serine protease